jgi:predicted nucleotide-binding protein
MVTGAPASVFISYPHADEDLARALATVLQDRGVRIWIDEGELRVGDSIIERIATAIAEIDFPGARVGVIAQF